MRDCFKQYPSPPIGAGRIKVRDRLRQLLEENQKLNLPNSDTVCCKKRAEFDHLCDEWVGLATKKPFWISCTTTAQSSTGQGSLAIASYSTKLGPGGDLRALRPKKGVPAATAGQFNRADLEALIWSGYTPEERNLFLGMMESCGISFRVRELPQQEQSPWWDKEWEYIARNSSRPGLKRRIVTHRKDTQGPSDGGSRGPLHFLHEAVLRGSTKGSACRLATRPLTGKTAVGLTKRLPDTACDLRANEQDAESKPGVRLRAWGEK